MNTNSKVAKAVLNTIDFGLRCFLLPFFFLLIWNKIMPSACGFAELTYWQAFFLGLGLRLINGTPLVSKLLYKVRDEIE